MKEINKEDFKDLFDYQFKALNFIEQTNGKCLLAWDTGTGKTCECVAYMNLHPEYSPVLLVTPSNVKFQWEAEYYAWIKSKKSVQIISGRSPQKIKCPIVIINYDVLADHVDVLLKQNFQLMVGDEIQYIKAEPKRVTVKDPKTGEPLINPKTGDKLTKTEKTKRYAAFKKLSKHIPHIIALSATPITRYPSEFFNILNILMPDVFKNRYAYKKYFCGPTYNGFGWQYKGCTHEGELKELISMCMNRQKKLKNGMIRTPIYLDINAAKYQNKFRKEQTSDTRVNVYFAKRDQIFEFVDNLIENEKVVLFAYNKKVVDDIQKHYKKKCLKIYGSTSSEERRDIIQKFQEDKSVRMIVGNIQSIGVGVDGLQKVCSTGIFVQFPWTSAEREQVEGRLDRTGQKKRVNYYYMIARDSIDEDDIARIEDYMVMFNKVIANQRTPDRHFLDRG